jgi:hypothetical protein
MGGMAFKAIHTKAVILLRNAERLGIVIPYGKRHQRKQTTPYNKNAENRPLFLVH